MGQFYVYLMASDSGTLYAGFTDDLPRRIVEHKEGRGSEFTRKYRIHKLVYYEVFEDPISGIEREKQIKGYRREKKEALIRSMNPGWRDLSLDE